MSEHIEPGTEWLDLSNDERAEIHKGFDNEEAGYIAMAEIELATLREEYLTKQAVLNRHRVRVLPFEFTAWMNID